MAGLQRLPGDGEAEQTHMQRSQPRPRGAISAMTKAGSKIGVAAPLEARSVL